MANRKTMGLVLLVIGIVVLIVSLLADTIGIGGSASVFGFKQILGTVVGAVLAVAGLVVMIRK